MGELLKWWLIPATAGLAILGLYLVSPFGFAAPACSSSRRSEAFRHSLNTYSGGAVPPRNLKGNPMKKHSIHSLIAAAALLACGAAQAAQFDLSGGTAIGHMTGVGDQSLLTLHAAVSATDPAALPLIARLDIAQGLQSGGQAEQTLGLGLYRFVGPAGAWRLEAGAEAGRWEYAGATARHVAGVLRASYAVAPAVALDSTLKLGHSSGLLGGRYTALGVGLDLFQIDSGTVRLDYQHIDDGALPAQDRCGLTYGASF